MIFGSYHHQRPSKSREMTQPRKGPAGTYMDDLSNFTTSNHTHVQYPLGVFDDYRHCSILSNGQ